MLWFIAFVLGVIIGSFVNVLVVRLAASEPMGGRSRCRSCGQQLAWHHNIPLLSFVWLKGRCAWCHQPICWQYPLVELCLGLLFAWGAYLMPANDWLWLITFWVLAAYATSLFVFDFRFKTLPDVLTLSGAVVLWLLNFIRGFAIESLLVASLVAAGFFAIQYAVSRGKWIGSGDIRLGLFMGAAVGWPQVLAALVISYWLGAGWGIMLISFKKNYSLKSALPFGTFLTASTVVVFLWGEKLIRWYLSFMIG